MTEPNLPDLMQAHNLIPYSVREVESLTADAPLTIWPSNLPSEGVEAIGRRWNLVGHRSPTLKRGQKVRLLLREWLVYRDEREDAKTGEIVPVTCTVFSDGNGAIWEGCGDVLPRRLKQLLIALPPGALAEGMPIEITAVDSAREGRVYHNVRALLPGEECP